MLSPKQGSRRQHAVEGLVVESHPVPQRQCFSDRGDGHEERCVGEELGRGPTSRLADGDDRPERGEDGGPETVARSTAGSASTDRLGSPPEMSTVGPATTIAASGAIPDGFSRPAIR